MSGPIAPERAAALARELAMLLARQRTHGNVYMNGTHNPLPTEVVQAKQFIEMMQYVVGMTPEEFDASEAAMGYPRTENMPGKFLDPGAIPPEFQEGEKT